MSGIKGTLNIAAQFVKVVTPEGTALAKSAPASNSFASRMLGFSIRNFSTQLRSPQGQNAFPKSADLAGKLMQSFVQDALPEIRGLLREFSLSSATRPNANNDHPRTGNSEEHAVQNTPPRSFGGAGLGNQWRKKLASKPQPSSERVSTEGEGVEKTESSDEASAHFDTVPELAKREARPYAITGNEIKKDDLRVPLQLKEGQKPVKLQHYTNEQIEAAIQNVVVSWKTVNGKQIPVTKNLRSELNTAIDKINIEAKLQDSSALETNPSFQTAMDKVDKLKKEIEHIEEHMQIMSNSDLEKIAQSLKELLGEEGVKQFHNDFLNLGGRRGKSSDKAMTNEEFNKHYENVFRGLDANNQQTISRLTKIARFLRGNAE
jgi:hypothetical protein